MYIPGDQVPAMELTLQEDYGIDSLTMLYALLDEHAQLLAFFSAVMTLQKRAGEEHLELVYHIFADGTDDFDEDPAEALSLYLRHRADGKPNVRLWYHLYSDRENDEQIEENHMIGYGDYPG